MNLNFSILLYSISIVFIAGFIRGYSGFGASMIIVTGLSIVFKVSEIVPPLLLLEVIASLYLLRGIYKKTDWSSLTFLLGGIVFGTPIGVYSLKGIPDKEMSVIVSLIVLFLVPFLWKGFKLKEMPGKFYTVITGFVSGIINGTAAIGGPPVIIFYFSSPKGVEVSRASLIVFFLITDIFASALCGASGLITIKTFYLTGIFIAPLVAGLYFGSRSFIKTDPEIFRKRVISLISIMAVSTFVKAVL